MSRLITSSLIGAVNWYKTCPPSWRERATKDLRNQLGRIWSPPNKACELGIKFEDAVCKATLADEVKGTEHFKWAVAELKGGEFQRKTSKDIEIDGHTYCLYGKIDAYFPTIIKDLKTTSNWKGEEYYTSSFQHRIYCYNERIPKFRYCVAEFNDMEQLVAHHPVDIEFSDFDALEAEIISKVKEVVSFIESSTDLFDLYINKFCKH